MNDVYAEVHEEVEPVHVELHVVGLPPYKQVPANLQEATQQRELRKQLQEAARKGYHRLYPLNEGVILSVRYQRNHGRADPTNIIGGIADSLRKIVFAEETNIAELHYQENPGPQDEYWVEVKNQPTHVQEHHHHY